MAPETSRKKEPGGGVLKKRGEGYAGKKGREGATPLPSSRTKTNKLMTDIFIFMLAVATAAGIAGYKERKKRGEGAAFAPAEDQDGRVYDILHRAYRDMTRQRMAAVGPWIPAALERRCSDPAVALTAVRWTLRDIQNLPVGEGTGYIPGLSFRYDLTGLEEAARELEGMRWRA